jgi:hypothetical protein
MFFSRFAFQFGALMPEIRRQFVQNSDLGSRPSDPVGRDALAAWPGRRRKPGETPPWQNFRPMPLFFARTHKQFKCPGYRTDFFYKIRLVGWHLRGVGWGGAGKIR